MIRTGALLLLFAGSASGPAELTVSRWTPAAVASAMWESHPAIDPDDGDLWFVRSDRHFAGWRLYRSRCSHGQWSEPERRPLAGAGLEADPWFSADGRTMWFISTGPGGSGASRDLDIWRRSRAPHGGWGGAERLPEPVNSASAEWFPRLARDGWLYFGSRRPGGFGKDDIWRARRDGSGRWRVENAGAGLNSASAEYEFEPARSGTWGILSTDTGLVRVVRNGGGWRRAGKYGAEVNADGTAIGPLILGGGHAFIFSRNAGVSRSGELFLAGRDRAAAPSCRDGR